MTVSQIDPASGPSADYADMATWEAALGSGVQEAVIWGTGDVGGMTLDDADPESISIYHRPGAQHDGRNNGNTGIAHALATWNIARSDVSIRGIAVTPASGRGISIGAGAAENITIESCRVVQANVSQAIAALIVNASLDALIVRNNVIYQAGASVAIHLRPTNSAGGPFTWTVTVDHNTICDTGSALVGIGLDAVCTSGTGVTYNATARNNVSIGCDSDFTSAASGAGAANVTFNRTCSHNASGDGTADDFGGSGHLVNQAAGDWFADVDADLRKRFGSPGIRAGATIAAVPTDFRGRRREGRHDIGFDQFPTLGDARTRRLLGCRE